MRLRWRPVRVKIMPAPTQSASDAGGGNLTGAVTVFSGGTLDAREAIFPFTTSNGATAHPGSRVYDPAGDFLFCAATALLTLPGGKLSDSDAAVVQTLPDCRLQLKSGITKAAALAAIDAIRVVVNASYG